MQQHDAATGNEGVPVTQADIEAAEKWRGILEYHVDHGGDAIADLASDFAKHRLTAQPAEGELRAALKLAISHLEHMANWIGLANRNEARGLYSFEGLGEDMPSIRTALDRPHSGGEG